MSEVAATDAPDVEVEDAQEELKAKQRKEKKELMAQITSLRKSVGGNKQRKKAVQVQIEEMEKKMEEEHKRQWEEFREKDDGPDAIEEGGAKVEEEITREVSEVSLEVAEPTPSATRVTKAQKRRDKKKQKERERLEEIEKQEELNKTGQRAVETEKIKSLLSSRGLRIHDIPSDGDCLYAGVSHQLQHLGAGEEGVQQLRAAAARVIGDNREEYLPFLTHPQTGDIMSEEGFRKYLSDLRDTKVWGGQLELRALSAHLQRPIEVVQAEGGGTVAVGEEFAGKDRMVLTYHRHMYSLGEHYNSTEPVDGNAE